MNTNDIERRLLGQYSDTYRRIWVQPCRLSKRRSEYRVCITLFPLEGIYTMIFSDIINDVNFEIISNIIDNNLQGTD